MEDEFYSQIERKEEEVRALIHERESMMAQLDASRMNTEQDEIVEILKQEKDLLTQKLNNDKGHFGELLEERKRDQQEIRELKSRLMESERQANTYEGGYEKESMRHELDEKEKIIEQVKEELLSMAHSASQDEEERIAEEEKMKKRIDSLEGQVEFLEQDISDKNEMLKTMEKQKTDLRETVNDLEIELAESKQVSETRVQPQELNRYKREAEELREKVEELSINENSAQNEIDALHQELSHAQNQSVMLQGEAQALRDSLDQNSMDQSQFAAIEEARQEFEEAELVKNEIIEKMQDKMKAMRDEREKERAAHRQEKEDLNQKVDQLLSITQQDRLESRVKKVENKTKEEENDQLRKREQALRKQLKSLNQENTHNLRSVNKLNEDLTRAKDEVSLLREKEEMLGSKLKNSESALSLTTDEKEKYVKDMTELREELMKSQMKKEDEINTLKQSVIAKSQVSTEYTEILKEYKSEMKELKTKNETLLKQNSLLGSKLQIIREEFMMIPERDSDSLITDKEVDHSLTREEHPDDKENSINEENIGASPGTSHYEEYFNAWVNGAD